MSIVTIRIPVDSYQSIVKRYAKYKKELSPFCNFVEKRRLHISVAYLSNSKPSKQILNLIKKVVVLNADQFFPIKILIGNVLMFKVNKYDSEAPPIVYIKVLNTKRLARFYKIIMKEISKIIPTISDPKEVMNFHITIGFLKSRKFINLIIKTIQKFKKDKSIFINLDKIQLRLSSKERILLKSYK